MRDIRVEVATCERLGPVKTAIRNVDSEVSMKHAATSTVGVSMPMSNRREKEEEEEEEGEEEEEFLSVNNREKGRTSSSSS